MTVTVPADMQRALAALRERPLSPTDKGLGSLGASGLISASTLADLRPSLFGPDFVFPLLVLREDALQANISAMAEWCAASGVRLAPHAKTTMAPQIIARQIAAGAWAVTAATIAQVQVLRAFGVQRVLLANELTDRHGIDWLAAELAADPDFDCYVYVDSIAGTEMLDEQLRTSWLGGSGQQPRRLPVLVELGLVGGRAGCRSVAQAVDVAKAAAATSTLRVAGAAGFEGNIGHDDKPATLAAITRFCRDLRSLSEQLPPPDPSAGPLILSAGGSAFFDIVVRELAGTGAGQVTPTVVLRSGAYVTHDHGFYARIAPVPGPSRSHDRNGPILTPALELWAPVLSRPEPALAIAGAGRRDAPFDQGMPVPIRLRRGDGQLSAAAGMRVTALDDQHAYLDIPPDTALSPGDLVCLGISHPCTALDKWRVIPVVDGDYRVTDAIHTFF
ncbi:MAG TPA: alanine racemase [Streptosporangiaceae bacterium]|nr:alanine racemase [Streptosporangiaceae bacterium]